MNQPAVVNLPSASPARAEVAAPPVPHTPARHSAFVPVLMCALALAGWLGSQVYAQWQDSQALQGGLAAQQQTVDKAGKLRASLDALAADTQRLADAGNASAGVLVSELRKRGITINAKATP